MKNFNIVFLLGFCSFFLSVGGCVVQPTVSSPRRSGQENFRKCIQVMDTQLVSQNDFWVKADKGQKVWMSRKQAIREYCLENQTKIEKQRSLSIGKLLEAKGQIQRKKYNSIRNFHQQCENFSTDVVGRWEAGCPISPQQRRELENRGYYP